MNFGLVMLKMPLKTKAYDSRKSDDSGASDYIIIKHGLATTYFDKEKHLAQKPRL